VAWILLSMYEWGAGTRSRCLTPGIK
jgi:hypothetical protein